jgi:hypothetical protein
MNLTAEPAATPVAAITSVVVNGKFCELSGPPGRSLRSLPLIPGGSGRAG